LKSSRFLFAAFLLFFACFAPEVWSDPFSLSGKVVRVYDGDTIQVANVGKVRMLGIDTPEWQASGRDRYYQRQGISAATLRRIATAARDFVVNHAAGQNVTLTVDSDARDRHGRLLAYVYLEDGRLLNRLLLEAGLAAVYRRFDFSLKSEFIAVEKRARGLSVGLWCD
jgi:micrococcal nuclease